MSQPIEYLRAFRQFRRNARLYLISSALSGVTTGILYVLYSLYLDILGYGTDFYGLILFVGTAGAGIAIFPAGFSIDRLGGKRILIWASMLIGLAGVGQILFRAPVPLLASAFVAGIGGAFILVANAPFLAANSTPEERPVLFSANIFVSLASVVLGEVLGGILPLWLQGNAWLMQPLPPAVDWILAAGPEPRSYQLALIFAGLIAFPSFIPLFLMDADHPVLERSTRERPARIPAWSGVMTRFTQWSRQVRWREVMRSPVTVLLVVYFLIGLGAGMFLPYLNIFFVRHLGASPALYGIINGFANLLHALLALLAPWLALRFGKILVIVVTRFLCVPVILLIGWTTSLPLAAVLFPFRQGLMNMAGGLLEVFAMETVSIKQRGLANSGYQAAYQVAWASSALAGGFIIQILGFPSVFTGAAILYTLALLLLWFRFGRVKEKPLEEKNVDDATNAVNNRIGV